MFKCDTCPATAEGTYKQAREAGWCFYARMTFYCPACMYKRQNPGVEDFAATGHELAGMLQMFLGVRHDPHTVKQMTHAIYQIFDGAVARRAILLAAEGMQVIGARPDDSKDHVTAQGVVTLEYQTKFYPHARFQDDLPEKYVALGFHKEYQLYFVPQAGLTSTVVARYGPEHQYTTYNPALQGLEGMAFAGEHFAVALQRLLFWRCDFEGWVADERARARL